ncbi:MAG TPA: hypothetical protein VMH61_00310, partial [Candidatus Acidoferrales bacterium]|nr:hypothetical protein [Candidatus Acidoferrales bacterium]
MTATGGRPGARLEAFAGGAFLLFAATLPGSIAPMEYAVGLCTTLTLIALWRSGRRWWAPTPVALPGVAWFVALFVVSAFALDRAGSFPRITKGLFPLLTGLAAHRARTRRDAERAIAVYFAAFALVSILGLGMWVAQGASFAERARGLVG